MGISQAVIEKTTVPSGGTTSGAVFIGTGRVFAVEVPTIDNAKLDWEASVDGSTDWRPVVDESLNSIEVNAGTGDYFVNMEPRGVGGPYVRIVLGSSQSADREFTIIIRN